MKPPVKYAAEPKHVREVSQPEVIVLVGLEPMALSQEGANLSLGLIQVFASPDLDSDGINGAGTRLAHTEDLLLRGRERKENHVVLICSTRRLSFPIEHADDRERHTADPDRPTDRIGDVYETSVKGAS